MTREQKSKTVRHGVDSPKNAGATPALPGLDEKGSVLVESAFTIAMLFVMVFGIMDFGRALYTYHSLSNAARDATRWASVNGATCGSDGSCLAGPASLGTVATYVRGMVGPGIDGSKINVQACGVQGADKCSASPAACTLNQPGCDVQVQLSYSFNFLVPVARGGSITLSSNSETIISH
ncbi:MAG: TadE/TadG family type IV pilus assembly protein [Candidatus Acidiferrales bacterium]